MPRTSPEPAASGDHDPHIEPPHQRPSLPTRAINFTMRYVLRPANRGLMHFSPSGGLRISSRLLGLTAPERRKHRRLVERRKVGGVPCDLVRPPSGTPERTVLYLHGGGFVAHVPRFYRRWGRELAAQLNAEVVIPDYRLAPRHPFPAASDDCVAVYTALLAEGCSPSRLVLMGDSAGGNLVLSTLLRLRDIQQSMPVCAVAISPATDLTMTSASLQFNARRDPMISPTALPKLARLYAQPWELRHHYVSPAYGDYSGLPPLAIFVGSTEVIVDDARRVAFAARDAGVDTELHVWPEMPHVFPLFTFLPEARTALEWIVDYAIRHTADSEVKESLLPEGEGLDEGTSS